MSLDSIVSYSYNSSRHKGDRLHRAFH